MNLNTAITCPHCKKHFELTEALSQELDAKLQDQLNSALKSKDEEYAKKLKNFELEKKELQAKAEADSRALKLKVENEIKNKISNQYELNLKDFKSQIEELQKNAEIAQKNELELLKKQREIEQQKKQFDLDMERKLSEERTKIELEAKQNADAATQQKLAEKDKQFADLQKNFSELQRKMSVGSQQLQGEVLELQIESLLREACPDDNIIEVKKGTRGADIIQEVYFQSGRKAGSIIYECKQTNDWGNQWVGKLKEDMREASSNVGVIVSIALPKEIKLMGQYEGVWVVHPSMVKVLSQLLREGLIKAARAELAAATPQDQKDLLFKYMTSPKFAQKIQAMFDGTITMKQTLDSEKRAIAKSWKKREQEIENFESQMINLYGELEGVVGKALPKVDSLELPDSSIDSE